MTSLPLTSVRVLDLSHAWAAPHATRLLADYGAEVIKVEYPRRLCILRGARRDDRFYDRQPGWQQVNRNKLAVTIDLERPVDREALRDLVRRADVIVMNSRPGVLDRHGFGPADLERIKPDLVILSMPAFGMTGPWASLAGYGAIFEAMGGIQNLTAYDRETRPVRIKEIDTLNGVVGACAVLTALLHRASTGEGQQIDLSQLEAAMHVVGGEHFLERFMNERQTLPLGNRHPVYAPQGCYRCAGQDRWVAITVRTDSEWEALSRALGNPGWASDPRYRSAAERRRHHDEIDGLIESWTSSRDHHEVMRTLQGVGVPAAAVLDLEEVTRDPHLEERGYFTEPDSAPGVRFMGMPIRLAGAAPPVVAPGPRLGEHNVRVRCDLLGRSQEEIAVLKPEDIGLAYDPE